MTLALHPQLRFVWSKKGRPPVAKPKGTKPGPTARFHQADFDEWVRLYRDEGLGFQAIAARYGISREYPRLKVTEILGPAEVRAIRARHRRQRESDRLAAELLKRMKNAKPCQVCGAWVLRINGAITCSYECGEVWRDGAWYEDPARRERHRRTCAESILRHAENRRPCEIEWAQRMLSKNPPPPNRQYSKLNGRMGEARRIKREAS